MTTPKPVYMIELENKLTREVMCTMTRNLKEAQEMALDMICGGPYRVSVEAFLESELDEDARACLKDCDAEDALPVSSAKGKKPRTKTKPARKKR